jgi:small basic protein
MNPFDWVAARVRELLELTGRQLFILAFAAWGLLLMPDLILGIVPGLAELRNQYRAAIGVAAFAVSLMLLGALIFEGGAWGLKRVQLKISTRQGIRLLQELTEAEKTYLRKYFEEQTRTQSFYITDGVVTGLCSKRILIAPRLTSFGTLADFNMARWAWHHLLAHPDLLE